MEKNGLISERARLAGLVASSKRDTKAFAANGRAAFEASFESKVDPDNVLTPEERKRRAQALRKAHFVRLTLASLKARDAKKNQLRS